MKMKALATLILLGIIFVLGACSSVKAAPDEHSIVISPDDFNNTTNVSKQVEVNVGDTFTISLDSNATTGFSWTEQANISNSNILSQTAHEFIAPQSENSETQIVGAPGSEEWTFKANQIGTAKVNLSYDRPWTGGEKGARTFELIVVVK